MQWTAPVLSMESPNVADKYDTSFISRVYEPFVVDPVDEHKQTFIVLHGRGGTGEGFASSLLSFPISPSPSLGRPTEPLTIRSCFPHAKFIFPTACLGLASSYNDLLHQWFDNWSPLYNPEYREDLMIEGLAETSSFIHSLLQQEINIIGARNVVLMGFSQGCSSTITSLLTWQGEPLAAAVGMSGWLPFRQRMLERADETSQKYESDQVDHSRGADGDDVDGRPPDQGTSRLERSVDWLKNELGIAKNPLYPTVPFQKIPLFLGHGVNDGVLRCELGRLASRCLIDLGIDTRWNEYNGLEHALSGNMLRDIVLFLDALEGW